MNNGIFKKNMERSLVAESDVKSFSVGFAAHEITNYWIFHSLHLGWIPEF